GVLFEEQRRTRERAGKGEAAAHAPLVDVQCGAHEDGDHTVGGDLREVVVRELPVPSADPRKSASGDEERVVATDEGTCDGVRGPGGGEARDGAHPDFVERARSAARDPPDRGEAQERPGRQRHDELTIEALPAEQPVAEYRGPAAEVDVTPDVVDGAPRV